MKNYKKINKTLMLLLAFGFLMSCGYEPLLNKENQKFSITEFEFEGNRRLGGLLKNNLFVINKEETNNLTLTIKSNKKIILSKVYSREQNYSASDIHLDTLNSEKKIVESMVESVASEILIELNSIYQE